MKRQAILVLATIVLANICQITSVQAGFIGQDVTAQWLYPTMSDVVETHDFLVGSTVELPPEVIQQSDHFSIDVGDDFILFTFFKSSRFTIGYVNGWEFSDKNGTVEEIIDFEIGMITGSITGLDPEDLTFTADSIFANFGNSGPNEDRVVFGQGSSIRLDITFIPEPCTLLLLGFGGLLIRKR